MFVIVIELNVTWLFDVFSASVQSQMGRTFFSV